MDKFNFSSLLLVGLLLQSKNIHYMYPLYIFISQNAISFAIAYFNTATNQTTLTGLLVHTTLNITHALTCTYTQTAHAIHTYTACSTCQNKHTQDSHTCLYDGLKGFLEILIRNFLQGFLFILFTPQAGHVY